MLQKNYFDGKSESDKKIVHLFVIEKCTHKCKLCCNNLYSVNDIPVVTVDELKTADTVCLTGGEPFLSKYLITFVKSLRNQYPNIKRLYVYTCGDSLYHWMDRSPAGALSVSGIDGVNISPKNKYDLECVINMFSNDSMREDILDLCSNRLYVFPNIDKTLIDNLNLKNENIDVINRNWQEDFEPESGIFRRLPILLEEY